MEFSILPTIEFHIQCLPGISLYAGLPTTCTKHRDLRALISPWPLLCLFPISLFCSWELELPEENFIWAVTAGFSLLCVCACSVVSLRPLDCSPPGSSVHGIPQARILEWVAIFFSRGSSWPRDQTWVLSLLLWQADYLSLSSPRKPIVFCHTGVKWSHSNEWDRYVNSFVFGKCLHWPSL